MSRPFSLFPFPFPVSFFLNPLSFSFPSLFILAVSFTLRPPSSVAVRLRLRRHPLAKCSRETDCLAVKRQFIC